MPVKTEIKIKADFQNGISFREAEIVDEKKRVAKVTIISVGPGNRGSKNFYRQPAIDSGAEIFEGARFGIDHPDKIAQQVHPEGSVLDIAGWFENVHAEGEALKGDLYVFPGEEFNKVWTLVKKAVEYEKKYPGKTLVGLSINAKGAAGEQIPFEGESWNAVDQFTAVKRVDMVTDPARGGKFEQVLSECRNPKFTDADFERLLMESEAEDCKASEEEKKAEDPGMIFQALCEKVRELEKTNAPGLEDVRRQLDQLGTALKLNKKQEADMPFPVGNPPGQPPAEKPMVPPEEKKPDFAQMAEAYAKMAESEVNPQIKAMHSEAAAHFKAQAESAAAPAVQSEEEAEAKKQAEQEAEAKKQAEGGQAEAKKESKTDIDYKAEFVKNKKNEICVEAGLTEAHRTLVLTLFEAEPDLKAFKTKVQNYAKVQTQESRRGHGFERREVPTGGNQKRIVSALEADGVLDMN